MTDKNIPAEIRVFADTKIRFGKHRDTLTFRQAMEKDWNYISWILKTPEFQNSNHPNLYKNIQAMVTYMKKDYAPEDPANMKFTFGQHKDKTVQQVDKCDPQYLDWLINYKGWSDVYFQNKVREYRAGQVRMRTFDQPKQNAKTSEPIPPNTKTYEPILPNDVANTKIEQTQNSLLSQNIENSVVVDKPIISNQLNSMELKTADISRIPEVPTIEFWIDKFKAQKECYEEKEQEYQAQMKILKNKIEDLQITKDMLELKVTEIPKLKRKLQFKQESIDLLEEKVHDQADRIKQLEQRLAKYDH